MKSGKGEVFVCQRCQTMGDDSSTMCHPHHTILVERSSITLDEFDRVIDCAQARQTFRAAKVST